MSEKLARIIEKIEQAEAGVLSTGMRRGLEKESLRIDAEGVLSRQPHPTALGAALTHRFITTDYSEALLEFVTPATVGVEDLLTFLTQLHQFTYRNIGAEKLWVNSMPCILHGEDSIAALCRREGINQNLYYRWSKESLKTGNKRLSADTAREATYRLANQGFDTNQHNRCVT